MVYWERQLGISGCAGGLHCSAGRTALIGELHDGTLLWRGTVYWPVVCRGNFWELRLCGLRICGLLLYEVWAGPYHAERVIQEMFTDAHPQSAHQLVVLVPRNVLFSFRHEIPPIPLLSASLKRGNMGSGTSGLSAGTCLVFFPLLYEYWKLVRFISRSTLSLNPR